jgi:hypothetical protein
MSDEPLDGVPELPESAKGAMIVRGTLNAASGAIPFLGGFLAAIAGIWGEKEQERINRFIEHWLRLFAEEMQPQRPRTR